jgi:hypothetical protein
MTAQIFLSCGQADKRERDAAARVREMFNAQGFNVYVAIQAQSIQDVNAGIIRQLERSDYYLFIDFRRERLGSGQDSEARGSLFTHQELALAYRSGFERVLFFQERGTRLEGLLRYMGANPIVFDSLDQLIEQLLIAFSERGWTTGYSRHLRAIRPRWSDGVIQYGELIGHFLYIDIENRRPDAAAYDTVARLEFIRPFTGARYTCPNRSHLKTTGQPGFVQTIWPQSYGAYDLLMLNYQSPSHLYLNNALDVTPRSPLISNRGQYALEYAVLTRDFPELRFTVELELKEVFDATLPMVREGWSNGA